MATARPTAASTAAAAAAGAAWPAAAASARPTAVAVPVRLTAAAGMAEVGLVLVFEARRHVDLELRVFRQVNSRSREGLAHRRGGDRFEDHHQLAAARDEVVERLVRALREGRLEDEQRLDGLLADADDRCAHALLRQIGLERAADEPAAGERRREIGRRGGDRLQLRLHVERRASEQPHDRHRDRNREGVRRISGDEVVGPRDLKAAAPIVAVGSDLGAHRAVGGVALDDQLRRRRQPRRRRLSVLHLEVDGGGLSADDVDEDLGVEVGARSWKVALSAANASSDTPSSQSGVTLMGSSA